MKKSMIYWINLYKNRKWNNYTFNTISYMMMIFLFKQMDRLKYNFTTKNKNVTGSKC